MRHYSLGMTERDRVNGAFGGGLPEGSVCLIEGGHGSGKSVLTQRMAYGLAEEGTLTGVVSTEMKAGEYIEQMDSLSYGIVDHLLEDRMLFYHADTDTHEFDGEHEVGTRSLLRRLFTPSPLWNGDVVVVDSFGTLLLNDPEFDAAVERGEGDHVMQRVVSALRSLTARDRSVVLTVSPDVVPEKYLYPLRHASGVYLDINVRRVGQEMRRGAVVRKFTGVKEPIEDTISFTVREGRGITIETRTIA
jgi:flagellar protein FlaH